MRRRLAALAVLAACPAAAQVTVAVDAAADQRPISPLVYGMNFASGAQLAAGIPLTRWGGNSTTRYNWQNDVHNTASDYFFENLPGCWGSGPGCSPAPADPETDSTANAFLAQAQAAGVSALFTVPTMGWVPKDPPVYAHPFPCGYGITEGAPANQDGYDQYDTNCGSGKVGGNWVAPPAATVTSIAVDAGWNAAWAAYLVGKFGPSNGKRIYQLDNEPNLWGDTHHDVHPSGTTYDELWQKMRDNAVALLGADPTAEISGPAEWGWTNYFNSEADSMAGCYDATCGDRAAHGGEELVAWLLDQARAYEQANGRRILHWLDLHYYPQGGSGPDNVRSLYDPTYKDPSWINDYVDLIPRMHAWADQHYPGTKLSISEYDWYDHDSAAGAVTYAEVLGTFGREGLDAATAWSPPGVGQISFAAYLLYRSYDGAGAAFGSVNARATVSGATTVKAYAATDPASGRLTVALVNEAGAPAPVTVSLAGFSPASTARYYENGGTAAIAREPDVAVTSGAAAVTIGATSIGMLVVDPALPPPDGGSAADAGAGADAGATGRDGGAGPAGAGPAKGGCGCGTGGLAFGLAGLGALLARRRRRA